MHKNRTFVKSAKRALKEFAWSTLLVTIICGSIVGWIVIPSISSNLQAGLTSYANGVSTYITVAESIGQDQTFAQNCLNGTGPCTVPLSASTIDQIRSLSGVEDVYATTTNVTQVIYSSASGINFSGSNSTITVHNFVAGFDTALLGSCGLPSGLVTLVAGRLPNPGEDAFVVSSDANILGGNLTLNQTYAIKMGGSGFSGVVPKEFNATLVGRVAVDPLLSDLQLFWDCGFMQNELGNAYFNETFPQNGTNFVVVKAENIGYVPTITGRLNNLLQNYPTYVIVYDQALIEDFQTFESQTRPYYELLGVLASSISLAVVFITSFTTIRRRSWEAGLLITQGWSWGTVYLYFAYYLVIIALASYLVGVGISYLIASQLHFSYLVYGATLTVPVSPVLIYVITGLLMSVIASQMGYLLSLWETRRKGLDGILREY